MASLRNRLRLFIKYVAVGAAGAIAYVILTLTIAGLGIGATISSFASYAALIPVVYLAQHRAAFRSQNRHVSCFPKYLVTQFLGLTLSGLVPYLVVQKGGSPPILAYIIVVSVVTTVNFFILKFWVFTLDEKRAKRAV